MVGGSWQRADFGLRIADFGFAKREHRGPKRVARHLASPSLGHYASL